MCGLGRKEFLEWARDRYNLRPDQRCINAAVSGRHEHVVDFIAAEPGQNSMPHQKAVDRAAANGKLAVLEGKCPGWGPLPDANGANKVAKNGRMSVLKWMVERGVYPDQDGANKAAKNG